MKLKNTISPTIATLGAKPFNHKLNHNQNARELHHLSPILKRISLACEGLWLAISYSANDGLPKHFRDEGSANIPLCRNELLVEITNLINEGFFDFSKEDSHVKD